MKIWSKQCPKTKVFQSHDSDIHHCWLLRQMSVEKLVILNLLWWIHLCFWTWYKMVDFSLSDGWTLCSHNSAAVIRFVPDYVVSYSVSNPTDITHAMTHDLPPTVFPRVLERAVCSLSHKTSIWAQQDPSPVLAWRCPPGACPSLSV